MARRVNREQSNPKRIVSAPSRRGERTVEVWGVCVIPNKFLFRLWLNYERNTLAFTRSNFKNRGLLIMYGR